MEQDTMSRDQTVNMLYTSKIITKAILYFIT
jgi:hypothetical protein